MNKKGFTLIEILTVVIILGIIMIIAIPSVSKYILDSRDSAYVTSIEKYIEAARNEITDFEYIVNKTNTTYYIPTRCLKVENGEESPYGRMEESYVVVNYDEQGFHDYYYIGRDDTNHGMTLTESSNIDTNHLRNDVETIQTEAVNGRARVVVYKDDCSRETESTNDPSLATCGEVIGESTEWTGENRTITVKCLGNCKQPEYTETFKVTKKVGVIQIADRNNKRQNCRVNVYVDKTKPEAVIRATKKDSGFQVASKQWSNEGLNFLFVNKKIAPSGTTIYYCQDTTNTCEPNIQVRPTDTITTYNNIEGIYYIRYKAESNTGLTSGIESYEARVDWTEPTCTFDLTGIKRTDETTTYVSNVGVTLNSSDNLSGIYQYGINDDMNLHNLTHTEDGNSITYNGRVKDNAGNEKTCNITFKKNSNIILTLNVNDGNAWTNETCTGTNTSLLLSTCKITVRYNETFGTIPTPTRKGYDFVGWYIGTTKILDNATVTLTKNETLTANWKAQKYIVTLDNNGATTQGSTTTYVTFDTKNFEPITLPRKTYTIKFDLNGSGATASSTNDIVFNYTIGGWYVKDSTSNGDQIADNNSTPQLIQGVDGYTDVEGKWKKDSGEALIASWESTDISLPTITKTEYNCGWYDARSDGNKIAGSGGEYTPKNNITLYAQCKNNCSEFEAGPCGSVCSEDRTGTRVTRKFYNDLYTGDLKKGECFIDGTNCYKLSGDHEYKCNNGAWPLGYGNEHYGDYNEHYYFKNNSPDIYTRYSGSNTYCYYAAYTNYGNKPAKACTVFDVTLNKQGGTGGTSTIYEKYNEGWYSNSAGTTAISKVTLPSKAGYKFDGYYTQTGTQIISNTGTINGNTNKTFLSSGTLYAKWTAVNLNFSGKTITKIYSTTQQTESFTAASNGTGSYTYSEKSETNSAGVATNFITVSGTTITIAAGTTAGTYTYVVTAKDNNTLATKDATFTITIGKATPTLLATEYSKNLTINVTDTFGVVPSVSGTLTWSSENTSIVTIAKNQQHSNNSIQENGQFVLNVKGKGQGKSAVNVTLKPSDTTNYNNASVRVTVSSCISWAAGKCWKDTEGWTAGAHPSQGWDCFSSQELYTGHCKAYSKYTDSTAPTDHNGEPYFPDVMAGKGECIDKCDQPSVTVWACPCYKLEG